MLDIMSYAFKTRGGNLEEKFIFFNDVKFTRDDKTGYYLNSTIRKRLHRYIWEFHHGEIPKGKQIHHINHDKSDNKIENLMIMSHGEHATYHGNIRANTEYERMKKNLDEKARPKAKEWHGSAKGIEWHNIHYQNNKHKLHSRKKTSCTMCNKLFDAYDNGTKNKFCSNKCKSSWRRKEGLDNESRVCIFCNEVFIVNKYKKNKCCSYSCANKEKVKCK
jgi:hypothetical protein